MLYTVRGLCGSMARLYCIQCVVDWYKVFSLRQGSGSACRSIYGGFVEWTMGTKVDGSDSRALQIASEAHWPLMRVLILVVSDSRRSVEKFVLCSYWMGILYQIYLSGWVKTITLIF